MELPHAPASTTAVPLRRALKLPRVGQIGCVVHDVDRAVAYYRETFGLGPWLMVEPRQSTCSVRGQPVEARLKFALAYSGRVQLELIQVLQGETLHTEALRESGEGLHHLGFFVPNLEKRLTVCRQRGIEILQQGTIKHLGLTIDYAYLDTVAIGGVLVELIQSRFGKLPIGMPSWLHRIVVALEKVRR
ncbi:MAG: VOC family protein [Anaerolineae bacterium]|nr:VOC family protein [Anaerolineae bacterium]